MITTPSLPVFTWPAVPPFLTVGTPVLVRVATSRKRSDARAQLRAAAREILSALSGASAAHVSLGETPRGPHFVGEIGDHPVALSFSYCGSTGWIGFLRGGVIGLDAMRPHAFAEIESVARLYLGPVAQFAIAASNDPARAFAHAWTALEARLKCLQRDLTEWDSRSPAPVLREYRYELDDTVVTVVTAASPLSPCAQNPLTPSLATSCSF